LTYFSISDNLSSDMMKITIIKPAVKKESKVGYRGGLTPSKDGLVMSTLLYPFIKKIYHKGHSTQRKKYLLKFT